jgi:hypothetical protein
MAAAEAVEFATGKALDSTPAVLPLDPRYDLTPRPVPTDDRVIR